MPPVRLPHRTPPPRIKRANAARRGPPTAGRGPTDRHGAVTSDDALSTAGASADLLPTQYICGGRRLAGAGEEGKTLIVTGGLTRADWVTYKYAGYGGQAVNLQFRTKGVTACTTVTTVTTGTGGTLNATVEAATDGYWRWTFAGTSTTSTATSSGDYVDVK